MSYKRLLIEVGSYHVASNPTKLVCLGLGSCVGIALYDPYKKIGGLAHAMLPKYESGRDKTKPGKYVDSSIYVMVDQMIEKGCKKGAIKAKIVGGAQMFSFMGVDTLDIGTRNVEAARDTLKKEKISLASEEVGGSSGRTIIFDIKTGKIKIKVGGKPAKKI